MFGSTYAVCWDAVNGNRCAGRLDLDGRTMILTGASNGCHVKEAVPLSEVDDVRLEGGRLYLTRRNARPLAIASLDAPGSLREVAERLAVNPSAGNREHEAA